MGLGAAGGPSRLRGLELLAGEGHAGVCGDGVRPRQPERLDRPAAGDCGHQPPGRRAGVLLHRPAGGDVAGGLGRERAVQGGLPACAEHDGGHGGQRHRGSGATGDLSRCGGQPLFGGAGPDSGRRADGDGSLSHHILFRRFPR